MKLNIKLVKEGYSRTCLLIGRWAIKYPNLHYSWRNFIRGLNDNLHEVDVHRYTKENHPENYHLLCPILGHYLGSIIIIMPRCEQDDLCEQNVYHMYELLRDARLHGDDSCSNFGRLDGRIVKLDYGHAISAFD